MAFSKNYALVAVINSPGAALIGDDLDKFIAGEAALSGVPCFALENAGFSGSFGSGYQKALIKTFDILNLKKEKQNKYQKVNLIGLSIYQKYYNINYKTIIKMLKLCGIETVCAPGAGDSLETIKNIPSADLNIVVYPEYGNEIAEYLKERFAVPYMIPEEGPPIGFHSAAAFVKQICGYFGVSSAGAEIEIDAARAGAYLHLSRFSSLLGMPRGCLFSVKTDASAAYTITRWLCSYLGMIPAAVSVLPGGDPAFIKKLEDFLASANHSDALTNPIIETPTQILLADGNTISEARLFGQKFCGIEISLPSLGYIDVTEKTLFGAEGGLFLLEQILNGLRYVMWT
jgi:nitrogenase molybdenum-iron protein alpha/beta subunit